MSILDKAKEHYKAKLEAPARKLNIPEWDAEVYVKPGISLEKLGEIMELSNSGKSAEAMAMTLVHRLVDDAGRPIFKRADRLELLKSVDPDVLARVVTEINSADPDQEIIEGN